MVYYNQLLAANSAIYAGLLETVDVSNMEDLKGFQKVRKAYKRF